MTSYYKPNKFNIVRDASQQNKFSPANKSELQ